MDIDVNVYDVVNLTQDVNLLVDELYTSIFESIVTSEWVGINDLVVELGIDEAVTVEEYASVTPVFDFSSFLRGLPFIETTEHKIESIEYSNGIEQLIDRWGRGKRRFNITFPISHLDEATPVRDFFIANVGSSFQFRNPLDDIVYDVEFVPNSWEMERRFYSTYYAHVALIEVF